VQENPANIAADLRRLLGMLRAVLVELDRIVGRVQPLEPWVRSTHNLARGGGRASSPGGSAPMSTYKRRKTVTLIDECPVCERTCAGTWSAALIASTLVCQPIHASPRRAPINARSSDSRPVTHRGRLRFVKPADSTPSHGVQRALRLKRRLSELWSLVLVVTERHRPRPDQANVDEALKTVAAVSSSMTPVSRRISMAVRYRSLMAAPRSWPPRG
jgi:hypothetical protein